MAPLVTLSGAQSGLTVAEIHQIICDDWGYPEGAQRIANMTLRRVNRALREIWSSNPQIRAWRVGGADVELQAGVQDYDVREDVANGGFGWTSCYEVLEIVIPEVYDFPLAKIDWRKYREHGDWVNNEASPMSWTAIDAYRIRILPIPDRAYTGTGDYISEIPSLQNGKLNWPRAWDEAILAGVQMFTAMVKLRDKPASLAEYRRAFEKAKSEINEMDKVRPQRPNRAVVTRAMRSRLGRFRDNSTDVRGRY